MNSSNTLDRPNANKTRDETTNQKSNETRSETPNEKRGLITFIGAGPGSYDLLTLRANRVIKAADVIIYAGSLLPKTFLDRLANEAPGVRMANSAQLNIQDLKAEFIRARDERLHVARLHSGDCSLYSAVNEQIAIIGELGLHYDIIPGVSAVAASAARLGCELTAPGQVQSIVLTRMARNSTAMPTREKLADFAATGSVICLHLAASMLAEAVVELGQHFSSETSVALCYRIEWPQEQIIRATLGEIVELAHQNEISKGALLIVGLSDANVSSYLYSTKARDKRMTEQAQAANETETRDKRINAQATSDT